MITYLNPDEGLHVQHPSLIADLLFSLLPPQHYHPLRHEWAMATEPLPHKLRMYKWCQCGKHAGSR